MQPSSSLPSWQFREPSQRRSSSMQFPLSHSHWSSSHCSTGHIISISSSYRTHNIVLQDTQYQYHRPTGHTITGHTHTISISSPYRTHNINIIVLQATQYHCPTGHTINIIALQDTISSYRTHNIVLQDTQHQYHRPTGHTISISSSYRTHEGLRGKLDQLKIK